MKNGTCVVLLLLLSLVAQAQKATTKPKTANPKPTNPYELTDKKALEIPESQATTIQGLEDYIKANFKTDSDKVRAIFIWTASNIQYDIDNMFALNFHEKREEKACKSLKSKKGICENYAAIFN